MRQPPPCVLLVLFTLLTLFSFFGTRLAMDDSGSTASPDRATAQATTAVVTGSSSPPSAAATADDSNSKRLLLQSPAQGSHAAEKHRSHQTQRDGAIAKAKATAQTAATEQAPAEDPLKHRLHDFVRRVTSQPVPPEFVALRERQADHSRRLHHHHQQQAQVNGSTGSGSGGNSTGPPPLSGQPQRPCTEAADKDTTSLPPEGGEGLRAVLAADERSPFLADIHASSLAFSDLHTLRDLGLERPVAAFPNTSRCAVVGSAARLAKERHGEEIDAHDVVVRVNLAPVVNFTRQVGARRIVEVASGLNIVNRWIPSMAESTTRRNASQSKEAYGSVGIVPGIIGPDLRRYMNPVLHHSLPKHARFLAMSPDIRRLGNRLYCHFSDNGAQWPHPNRANDGNGIAPTSGFLAVLYALIACQEVSLFGFGDSPDPGEWSSQSDLTPQGPAHYFDEPRTTQPPISGGHWLALEHYLLHLMAEQGLVRWH